MTYDIFGNGTDDEPFYCIKTGRTTGNQICACLFDRFFRYDIFWRTVVYDLNDICDASFHSQLLIAVQQFLCKIRSEEHTSELQSRFDLVCRLLPVKINT